MDSVAHAFEEFIAAFNALDLPRFRRCLDAEVSLFAPAASHPHRIDGIAAVVEHFTHVFEVERPVGPEIRPDNVQIRALGSDTALVSFEFARAGGSTGRRTLVFRAVAQAWRIVHIHASNTQT